MKTFSEYVQQILIDHLLCQALRSALNQMDSGLPSGSPPVTVPLEHPVQTSLCHLIQLKYHWGSVFVQGLA